MNQFDFNGVEAEKAYAMRRYNERRSFLNILRAAEAAAAVALLGYWCFPAVIISLVNAVDWFRRIGAVIDQHSFTFVLINVLIISIIILSHEKSENQQDLYNQYTSATATAVVYPVPVVRDDSHDKQIVPVKSMIESTSAAVCRPGKRVKAEAERVVCCCEAVTAVKSSYQRTRSERKCASTEEKQVVQRLEYRRSESSATVRGEKVSAWGSRAVEGLSSEEFRVTVERFIMEKKRTLLEENDVVVHRRGHRGHPTSKRCSSSSSALVTVGAKV